MNPNKRLIKTKLKLLMSLKKGLKKAYNFLNHFTK